MGGGGCGGWRGCRRRKCDLFFSSAEIPKTQWGGLVSLGLLTKEPQFSLLLDSLCISTVISRPGEAELNSEQHTTLSECYKCASTYGSVFANHCVPQMVDVLSP